VAIGYFINDNYTCALIAVDLYENYRTAVYSSEEDSGGVSGISLRGNRDAEDGRHRGRYAEGVEGGMGKGALPAEGVVWEVAVLPPHKIFKFCSWKCYIWCILCIFEQSVNL